MFMNHNTRKLNILHELDIAIKRKTQQRSKDMYSSPYTEKTQCPQLRKGGHRTSRL